MKYYESTAKIQYKTHNNTSKLIPKKPERTTMENSNKLSLFHIPT